MIENTRPCESEAFGLALYSQLTGKGHLPPDEIHNHVTKDDDKVIFKDIVFDDEVLFEQILDNPCNYRKHMEIINCVFASDVFIDKSFESLVIDRCCFEGKFYINKQYSMQKRVLKVDALSIKNSKFHGNFKLHNVELKNFILQDVDFERNADFFKTKFLTSSQIVFHAVNFRALALFGDTVFKEHLLFEYVTFEGYSHFRNAVFNKGLNLEYANIEKEMNFFGISGLDAQESRSATSRETYRTVKYQLQKVGNIIDANKYHTLELDKKRQDACFKMCDSWTDIQDCVVLLVHKASSNYSTNWTIALGWIVVVGFASSYGLSGKLWNPDFYKFSSVLTSFEDFNGMYWLFILNKILLGYLYYQFVSAVRKDTKF
ncbi:MAG: hypothetical protein IBX55_21530 [Methyloprofundus sp.]|nr:hypothetical protein [Methyloprofundus sp.]